VVTVVAGGNVVLEEGRLTAIDEAAVLAECQSAAWALARRAKLPWDDRSGIGNKNGVK